MAFGIHFWSVVGERVIDLILCFIFFPILSLLVCSYQKMNNNYGFQMSDNYKVYLKLLEKNRENESSDDSEFDSDYDGRLDDSFNRLIKERNMKKLVKKDNSTFTLNEPPLQSPTENAQTPKESDGALELNYVNLECDSYIVDTPNFTPSLNSTICSSVLLVSDEPIKQSNSVFVARIESVREESSQQNIFLNPPQNQSARIVDVQKDDAPFNAHYQDENRPHNLREVDTEQVVRVTDLTINEDTSSFVAHKQSARKDYLEQHFLNLSQNNKEPRNPSSVADNQTVPGVNEEIQQNSPIRTLNQSDRVEVTRKDNSTNVHNRSTSDGQEEIESSPHVDDDKNEKHIKLQSSNSTMNNGNESSWTDCDDGWTDCDSFADDEVFK